MTGKKLSRALRRKDEDRPFYTFALGYSEFGLPSELASRWGLEKIPAKDRLLKMIMDVAGGPHNHVWAQKSIETDDAQRLGVAVCYAAYEPVWLTNVNPSAVAAANTCVDILTGKMSTSDVFSHRWSSDRDLLLGPWGPYISRRSWDDVFRNPDRRRDALRKQEPLKPTWKPQRFYLKHYNAIMEYCGPEQNPKPPACIDPLTAPAPPLHPTQLRSYLLRTRAEQSSPENARGLL